MDKRIKKTFFSLMHRFLCRFLKYEFYFGGVMEVKEKERVKRRGVLSGLSSDVRESIKREGTDTGSFKLWINLSAVVIGFLFGGCHLFFGSYPLGLALVSALPSSVWFALLGVSLGSLTLGRSGIIYALIGVLAVFLRVIISGGEKVKGKGSESEKALFSENVTLRVCSAVISGFVAAIYEILLESISFETVLFGVCMVILPALFTFLFSGAFYHDIGVRELIFGTKRIFVASENRGDKMRLYSFKASLLVFIALAAFSLNKYNIFGINLSFVFSGCITLFAAKRFGTLYGAVVGFVSSALVSGLYSAGFALLGAASGALFVFGVWYAIGLGGALLSIWGAYVSGVSGFLALLPEYLISCCIVFPTFRFLEREEAPEIRDNVKRRATDMVGTMALAYRNRKAIFSEPVEDSMKTLIPMLNSFSDSGVIGENYALLSKIIAESKQTALSDREMDEELTGKIEGVFLDLGFKSGVIRAFGERKKYVICSGEDKDGTLITSPLLRRGLEEASGLKFSEPEYYRRDDMVLMQCEATKQYKLDFALACAAGTSGEVSGDSVDSFETGDLYAHGLISDGMGSGSEAKKTSRFAVDFLKSSLGCGASYSTLIHMLNSIIRSEREECSATVDLFTLDLITGEATFIKSGAAPSYIKRKSSLFRIKSETMPLGIIKQVDAEKISAAVTHGDYIIMLSDGISDSSDDPSWLPEFLNKSAPETLSEYAEKILAEAKRVGRGKDDMSVLVMRVEKL